MKFTFLWTAGLLLASAPVAAQSCPGDDAFEDNESCATAWPLVAATYPNLVVHDNDEDLFRIRLLPGEELHVDIFFDSARGDLSLYLDDEFATQCGQGVLGIHVAQSVTSGDSETISYVNGQFDRSLVLHVDWADSSTPGCNEYTLVVAFPGACPGDDAFEENDSCTSATRIARGTYENLTSTTLDDDFYVITVPGGDTATMDLLFRHGDADLDLALLNSDCSTLLDTSSSTTDDEQIVWTNASGAPRDYVIRVNLYGGGTCANYALVASVGICEWRPADPWEDNDDCATAPLVGPGYLGTLQLSHDDEDFFRFVLEPGETLVAELLHNHSQGDVDLYLYDEGDSTCGLPGLGSWLAASRSSLDEERVTWLNGHAQPETYVVHVDWYGAMGCNDYRLLFSVRPPMTLGAVFCGGNPNSTGQGATLQAVGSPRAADNDLRLVSERLPQSSFGYFLNSVWAGNFVPPASMGILCIHDATIGRYNRPGEIRNSGSSGVAELVLDLSDTPRPFGTTVIAPGEGWSFQYWYRDTAPGGSATSNLSDAIRVIFI